MVKAMSSSLQPSTQSSQSGKPSSQTKNEFGISCEICAATYMPSQADEYLLRAPRIALESAFMSMCHFCFRCRRPACPNCWDEVHGICGSCDQEVHLPFRSEGESLPLNTKLLVPAQLASTQRSKLFTSPLICVRPGRFLPNQPAPSRLPIAKEENIVAEIEPVTQPPLLVQKEADKIKDTSGKSAAPELSAQPASPLPQKRQSRARQIAKHVERILTVIVFVIVVMIVALIIMASLSEQANVWIAHTLRVDIRAEIAYLLQLIHRLH